MFSLNYNQWGLRYKRAWKREWKELAVLQCLRHWLAQRLGQHEGGQAGHQGRHAEEAGRVAAQQQQVRGQDGSQPAHHHAETHAHATHHRGKLFGGEEVEDGVGAVAGEPTNDGDGNSELKEAVRVVVNKSRRFLFLSPFYYFFFIFYWCYSFFLFFKHIYFLPFEGGGGYAKPISVSSPLLKFLLHPCLSLGYSGGMKGWVNSAAPVRMRNMHIEFLRPKAGRSRVQIT